MRTREIHTPDGAQWTLTEALVGTDAERDESGVPVVATPSGGEQTLRLALDEDWADAPDESLVASLATARDDEGRADASSGE